MAELKDLIKGLTGKVGKMQEVSKQAAENVARSIQAAKETAKTLASEKGQPYRKK